MFWLKTNQVLGGTHIVCSKILTCESDFTSTQEKNTAPRFSPRIRTVNGKWESVCKSNKEWLRVKRQGGCVTLRIDYCRCCRLQFILVSIKTACTGIYGNWSMQEEQRTSVACFIDIKLIKSPFNTFITVNKTITPIQQQCIAFEFNFQKKGLQLLEWLIS